MSADGLAPAPAPIAELSMEEIVRGLESRDAKTTIHAVRTLATKSRENEWKEKAFGSGAVQPLCHLIEPGVPSQIRLLASRCLFNLSVLDGVRKQMVEECECLKTLLLCVAADEQDLRLHSIGTVANIATNKGNKSKLVKLGVLKIVITVIRQTDADRVLQHACRALFALAADDTIKVAIVQEGGLPPLIRCLRSNSVHVQWHASGALANLALSGPNKTRMVMEGGLTPLCTLAMSRDVRVQRQVARALFALASQADLRPMIVAADVVPALVALLSSENVEVQRNAAGALGNIAMTDRFKETIIERFKALPPLIALAASECAYTQRQACRALLVFSHAQDPPLTLGSSPRSCTSGDLSQAELLVESHRARIAADGGITALVLLAKCPHSECARDAAAALANLAEGPHPGGARRSSAMVAAGALEPLCRMLSIRGSGGRGGGTAAVQMQAVRAVCAMSQGRSREHRLGLIRHGCLKPLLTLLYSSNDTTCRYAATTLRNLAEGYAASDTNTDTKTHTSTSTSANTSPPCAPMETFTETPMESSALCLALAQTGAVAALLDASVRECVRVQAVAAHALELMGARGVGVSASVPPCVLESMGMAREHKGADLTTYGNWTSSKVVSSKKTSDGNAGSKSSGSSSNDVGTRVPWWGHRRLQYDLLGALSHQEGDVLLQVMLAARGHQCSSSSSSSSGSEDQENQKNALNDQKTACEEHLVFNQKDTTGRTNNSESLPSDRDSLHQAPPTATGNMPLLGVPAETASLFRTFVCTDFLPQMKWERERKQEQRSQRQRQHHWDVVTNSGAAESHPSAAQSATTRQSQQRQEGGVGCEASYSPDAVAQVLCLARLAKQHRLPLLIHTLVRRVGENASASGEEDSPEQLDLKAAIAKVATEAGIDITSDEFESLPFEHSLGKDLDALLNQSALADVRVVSTEDPAKRCFFAHKAILCARCDYFRAFFDFSGKEHTDTDTGACMAVVLLEDSWGVLELLLRYLYTGEVALAWREQLHLAVGVMSVASRLCVEGLQLLCETEIGKHLHHFTADTVVALLVSAHRLQAPRLKTRCTSFLLKHHPIRTLLRVEREHSERGLLAEAAGMAEKWGIADSEFLLLRPQAQPTRSPLR